MERRPDEAMVGGSAGVTGVAAALAVAGWASGAISMVFWRHEAPPLPWISVGFYLVGLVATLCFWRLLVSRDPDASATMATILALLGVVGELYLYVASPAFLSSGPPSTGEAVLFWIGCLLLVVAPILCIAARKTAHPGEDVLPRGLAAFGLWLAVSFLSVIVAIVVAVGSAIPNAS